jgi:transposase-like protein
MGDAQPGRPKPGASGDLAPQLGRFSARRKQEIVLHVFRGEPLETVSREVGVTAATLSAWRDQFLFGGTAALKARQPDPKDEEVGRLHAKVGELTMENELLREKLARLEGGQPFPPRRPRP